MLLCVVATLRSTSTILTLQGPVWKRIGPLVLWQMRASLPNEAIVKNRAVNTLWDKGLQKEPKAEIRELLGGVLGIVKNNTDSWRDTRVCGDGEGKALYLRTSYLFQYWQASMWTTSVLRLQIQQMMLV